MVLKRHRGFLTVLRDEVDAEHAVEDEAVAEDEFALLVALDDLAIGHLAADGQQGMFGVLGEHGEPFLRTALFHALQADVGAFQRCEAEEEGICGLGKRGGGEATNSQVLSMPKTWIRLMPLRSQSSMTCERWRAKKRPPLPSGESAIYVTGRRRRHLVLLLHNEVAVGVHARKRTLLEEGDLALFQTVVVVSGKEWVKDGGKREEGYCPACPEC